MIQFTIGLLVGIFLLQTISEIIYNVCNFGVDGIKMMLKHPICHLKNIWNRVNGQSL